MAIKQYSPNIPPPEKMTLFGNVANNWRTFKREFLVYSIVNRLSKKIETSAFLTTIGQDVFDIYDGSEFDNEEYKIDLL